MHHAFSILFPWLAYHSQGQRFHLFPFTSHQLDKCPAWYHVAHGCLFPAALPHRHDSAFPASALQLAPLSTAPPLPASWLAFWPRVPLWLLRSPQMSLWDAALSSLSCHLRLPVPISPTALLFLAARAWTSSCLAETFLLPILPPSPLPLQKSRA